MKMLAVILAMVCSIAFLSGKAYADSIYGSCRNKSGEKCTNVHRISTSWNSKVAYPSDGKYALDFGKTVNYRITIYCDGNEVGTANISGSTRFDLICR